MVSPIMLNDVKEFLRQKKIDYLILISDLQVFFYCKVYIINIISSMTIEFFLESYQFTKSKNAKRTSSGFIFFARPLDDVETVSSL